MLRGQDRDPKRPVKALLTPFVPWLAHDWAGCAVAWLAIAGGAVLLQRAWPGDHQPSHTNQPNHTPE